MAARDPDQMRLKLRRLLVAARNAKGLNQTQLAERLGRRQNFVSACETGRGGSRWWSSSRSPGRWGWIRRR